MEIFQWTNKAITGSLFFVGLLFFLLIYLNVSVLSLISVVLLLHLLICFTFINSILLLLNIFLNIVLSSSKERGIEESSELLPKNLVLNNIEYITYCLNNVVVSIYNIYHCRNNFTTIKVIILIILLNLILRYVSDMMFFFIGILLIFLRFCL